MVREQERASNTADRPQHIVMSVSAINQRFSLACGYPELPGPGMYRIFPTVITVSNVLASTLDLLVLRAVGLVTSARRPAGGKFHKAEKPFRFFACCGPSKSTTNCSLEDIFARLIHAVLFPLKDWPQGRSFCLCVPPSEHVFTSRGEGGCKREL